MNTHKILKELTSTLSTLMEQVGILQDRHDEVIRMSETISLETPAKTEAPAKTNTANPLAVLIALVATQKPNNRGVQNSLREVPEGLVTRLFVGKVVYPQILALGFTKPSWSIEHTGYLFPRA